MKKIFEVAIVGGGPGGLLLAQGLKKEGIPVKIFERDRAKMDYLQGFRLRVRSRGVDAMKANLPPDLFTIFQRACGRAPAANVALDEHLEPIAKLPPMEGDDLQFDKALSRITLRQILSTGLEGIIEYEKKFTHYEEMPTGRVRVHFEDGSHTDCDILVGADGGGSRVRRQMLPHALWIDTGAIRIAGKIELTDETRAKIDPLFLTKTVGIRSSKRMSLFVMAHDAETRDGVPETIGINEASAELRPGLLFDNTKSFVMWSLSGHSDRIPAKGKGLASPDEQQKLLAFTLEAMADWHPAAREFVALTDPSTVDVMPIKTMLPVDPWPTRQITLMGDAIHGMTYFRALGANSSLHDANLLRAELALARKGEKPLIAAIASYEAAMREIGYAAMMASLKTYEIHHGELDIDAVKRAAAA